MQIILISISLIGLLMVFFGLKFLIRIRTKTITELEFSETPNEVIFNKIGTYSICFVGGGYANNIKNFIVNINKDEDEIYAIEKLMKFRFDHKGRLATEFYQFEIKNEGKHIIKFNNIQDLEVKDSSLMSTRIFQTKKSTDNIGVLIKETSSSWNFIIGLLMLVLGVLISVWGLILTFNPQIYK